MMRYLMILKELALAVLHWARDVLCGIGIMQVMCVVLWRTFPDPPDTLFTVSQIVAGTDQVAIMGAVSGSMAFCASGLMYRAERIWHA